MSQIFRTITVRERFDDIEKEFWISQCKISNSLFNVAVYQVRQTHFEKLSKSDSFLTYWKGDELRKGRKLTKIQSNYVDLYHQVKLDPNYGALHSQVAQQTIKSVAESVSSYNELVDLFFKGEVDRPSIPRYRKTGGMYLVTYPVQAVRFVDGWAILPVSQSVKNDLYFEPKVKIPHFVDTNLVREVRVRPSRGEFWVDWICYDGKEETESNQNLNYGQYLAIDHGVKFWLSCVTSRGKSFIVEAPQLKTQLHYYRDKVASHKKDKPDKYWDEHLDKLTSKYNLQVRDAVNKAARFIINRCLKDKIGNLIIGWNEGNKQRVNLGKKNNYEVVSMPTARLIKRLEELSKEYGIKLHVISEEYTSKASFLDRDELHNLGEKPLAWKSSGKRTTRDTYRTKSGLIVHADINAAANILRRFFKLNQISKLKATVLFKKLDGVLTDPKRYSIFKNLKRKYRKQTLRSASLDHVVTTV
ncbi:MAG: transposase [Cyanobacteria bacterium P01_C01_bin.38]